MPLHVMPLRHAAVFVVLAIVLGSGRVAVAKPPSAPPSSVEKRAAQLKQEGNRAMDTGRPADALELYKRAYEASPDPALLYNQARAHQALTNYVDAFDLLARFRAEAPPSLLAKIDGFDALVEELSGRIHTLSIAGAPDGTELRINGRSAGTTPLQAPLRLSAGQVLVEARREGFSPVERRISLEGGRASTIELTLTPIVTTAVVVVRASVAGATATVDGAHRGTTPFEVVVDPGPHDVVVSKGGFLPARSRVVVAAGERRVTTLTLDAEPGLLSRWWFWTAAGVLVAGGAATYVALTTEREAPIGSIPPGQISVRGISF